MKTLFYLLFLASLYPSVLLSTAWLKIRDVFAFDRQTKWNCFYRTTTPVDGLDPAIWRHDQYGNLLLAGLNFNCKGCLCYTFDHRYPISSIGSQTADEITVKLMSSIDNCQALSFRTNALKGSNEDHDIMSVVNRFGCDAKTMKLFEAKDHLGARAVQKYLLSEGRTEQIHQFYINYVEGPNFLDPKQVEASKEKYFKFLYEKAKIIAEQIETSIKKLNS